MQMNKADLIQHVAFAAGIEKAQAEKAIGAVASAVKLALSDAEGNPVVGAKMKVEGLGTWEVKETAARTVQNPQVLTAKKADAEGKATDEQKALLAKVASGEVWETKDQPASRKVGFRPEKALKSWVGDAEGGDDDNDAPEAPAPETPAAE